LESKNRHEVREAYDITSLDGRFPDDQLPEFRQTVSTLVPELCRLSNRLLQCLAVAIGLEEDYFIKYHQNMCQGSEKNATTFRSLYYPSLADQDVCAGVERCGAHSDYGTVTLLLQDDIGGLEVTKKCIYLPMQSVKSKQLYYQGVFWRSLGTSQSDSRYDFSQRRRFDAVLDSRPLPGNSKRIIKSKFGFIQ